MVRAQSGGSEKTAALPAQVGEQIAGYELCGILGRGGMGCVFDAIHKKLGRRCALKFLAPELVGSDEYVKRFLSEARIVNSVRHPNIVDIYDFLELDAPKRVAYVMEFVDGPSLGQLLKKRCLSVRQAINVTFQLADALEAVHARGVVHRDLKPDNILVLAPLDGDLSQVPSVKILDFGIAKGSADHVEHKTITGAILGTPSYMAPEQVAGQQVSPATDIYALGEIFYEMVTGQRLFRGDRIQMMTQKLGGQAPELTLPDDLTARDTIGDMVGRCLAVQPDMRPTMADLAGCLTEILSQQGRDAPYRHPLAPSPGGYGGESSDTPMAMASMAEMLPRPSAGGSLRTITVAALSLAVGLGASVLVYSGRGLIDGPTAIPLADTPATAAAGPARLESAVHAASPAPSAPQKEGSAGSAAAPPTTETAPDKAAPATGTPAKPEPKRRRAAKTRKRRRRSSHAAPKKTPPPAKRDEGSIIKKGTIPTW